MKPDGAIRCERPRDFILLVFLLCCCSRAFAERYYVDAEHGDDTSTGVNPTSAWRTVQRASGVVLKPGDSLLFHSGDSFNGVLEVHGTGDANHPIIISSYGEGAKPKLTGAGAPFALHLQNAQFVEVNNLIYLIGQAVPACATGCWLKQNMAR